MNQEIKSKWLCALEGGKYPKGEKALCNEVDGKRTYCCLGVLADMLGTEWKKPYDDRTELKSVNDESTSYLGEKTLRQINLSVKESYALAALNDRSDSFAPVIDYIREKL